MKTCILLSIPRYRKDSSILLSFFFSVLLFLLFTNNSQAQTAPNAQFADLTSDGDPTTSLTGSGTFNCDGMPDFTYEISGDIADGDTTAPDVDDLGNIDPQTIANNGGGFETIYGQADAAENIEVEVLGFPGPVGAPITNQVETTITFASETPSSGFAFIIADVEQDQVMICATDINGDTIPTSIIAQWWQQSFDADNSDGINNAPMWDTITGTLVGEFATVPGVKETTYQIALDDNEAGSAWFEVNVPIKTLTFKSQAMGIEDDDPSQHFIFASTCAVYDLALTKKETSTGPYSPGDAVTYDIQVCNQGNVTANDIEITDYIPADMTLSPSQNAWTVQADGSATTTIGTLDGGDCTILPISLTINDDFMGTSIINNAEITDDDGDDVDSTTGDMSSTDDFTDDDDLLESDGGDDEDPAEITVVQVYDLALIKVETSAGPYSPGDEITYDIRVCNQGTLDASSIEVTDHIPSGLSLSNNNLSGWMGPSGGPVTFSIASIEVDSCVDVPIALTIDPTFQGTSAINFAEITADNGDDIDSDPMVLEDTGMNDFSEDNDLTETDGGDDEDPEEVLIVQTYDLALVKEESSAGPYEPGDDVVYTITIKNQGSLNAGQITITDYIPAGMTLSSNNTGWVASGGSATNTLTGPLASPDSITVDIVLTIDPNFSGTSLVNDSEITMDSGDDVDSTPGDDMHPDDLGPDDNSYTETDGGDDQDPAEITVLQNIYDLALIKQESSSGPYEPGDDVSYTITVYNQGNVDAGIIEISDYIPADMAVSINDNNGWAGGPTGTVTKLIPGPTAGGDSVTVDIILTIDPALTGTQDLINNAEITADNGDDVDSTPGDNSQPDDLADDDNPNETDGGDDEDPELITVCACDTTASAGTMVYPGTSEGCLDDMGSLVTLSGVPTGDAVVPAGYSLAYVISVGYDLQVVGCEPVPTFTTDQPGWFTIHPIVYDPNTFDPCAFAGTGTIEDMQNIFANDPCVCADVDYKGVELGAYFCCMDFLQLDMNPLPPLLHDANIGLMSKGTVNMPNSTTRLTGGQFVELQQGFQIIQGSPVVVEIAPCADYGN